jgi:hypothetical protein
VRAPSSPPQSPPASALGGSQAPNVAGPLAPVEPPSSSALGTSRTTSDAKAKPEA